MQNRTEAEDWSAVRGGNNKSGALDHWFLSFFIIHTIGVKDIHVLFYWFTLHIIKQPKIENFELCDLK